MAKWCDIAFFDIRACLKIIIRAKKVAFTP